MKRRSNLERKMGVILRKKCSALPASSEEKGRTRFRYIFQMFGYISNLCLNILCLRIDI